MLTFHILCPLQSCVGPAMEPPQKLQDRSDSFIQPWDVVRVRLFLKKPQIKVDKSSLFNLLPQPQNWWLCNLKVRVSFKRHMQHIISTWGSEGNTDIIHTAADKRHIIESLEAPGLEAALQLAASTLIFECLFLTGGRLCWFYYEGFNNCFLKT